MLFIPQEKVLLKSKLPAQEVCQRLSSAMASTFCDKTAIPQTYSKSFEGIIDRHHFEINRLTKFSFKLKPRVKGKIISDLEGSWIEISMHLQTRTIYLWLMWLLMLSFGGILAFVYLLINGNWSHFAYIPMFLLPLSIALAIAVFNHEADQAIRSFKKILSAKVVKRRV